MASYNTLRRRDKNDEVKQLQEKLISQGYDLGSTGADGSYGPKTQEAVQKYQSDNGLQVDGIAGSQTLGKLYASDMPSVTQQTQTLAPPAVTTPAPSYRYDPQQDTVYQAALQKLQAAQENAPTYAGTYDQRLQEIYDRIVNRKPFSYDLNGDALWHQYKDQHVQQGQMAMEDAMGQAAALTGGYGNSYGQKVGQQTYNQHLQALTDKIPELYQLARSMYDTEGNRLAEQYAMTGDLAADEYGKYQDAHNLWLQNLERARADVDTAYDRGQNSWYTEHQLKTQAEDTQYGRQQDAYSRLVELITSTGYTPSQEELTAAGMRASEAAAYAKFYADQNVKTGSDGGKKGTGSYNNGKLSLNQVKLIQASLGVPQTGMWDASTQAAAGGYKADDAWALYYKGQLGTSVLPYQLSGTQTGTDGEWSAGITENRGTGAGQLKGSAWDYSKNNLSQLLRNKNYAEADKYMDQIVDQLSEEQFDELIRLFESYGYSFG